MLTPLLVSLILAAVMTGGHGQSAMSQIIDQEIIIGMPWNNMYDDNTSPAYANLKSKIETSLSSYYSNMTYFDRVSVTGIRSSSQGYVYIGYRIFFMVPSGYTYDQNQLLQMMYQLTSTGLTVDGVFYPPAGSGQTCSPSCKNGGTCSSGTCLCTVNYMGPDCSSSVMTSSHMEGQAELKIDWRDSYYDLESFEFFSFNRSLTEVLAGEFSYMPTFTRVLLTKFIPMDMAVRRKRQAVPVFKDVRIHYIVFFNSSLTPQEETMVESTITSIKNDGLVVGQTKYYPITHTGCTNHLECVYGYCSNGNCICNSGFTGKWCETSTTAGTEKEASVNLTMPYNANMENQSSFDYRVLKNQLTDAIQSRFMGFPYFARAWIKEIRIHHNFRQRRQAPSQVNMRVFEIFYGVAFSQYIAPGDSTDQQIDAAVKDISENGLEIYGVQYYPPGQQMNKRCDHFLTDPSAQQEVLQQCTTSFSAVDKTQLTQTQICQLYHAALGCSKVILLNHGYNCSYVEMDISPFTNILKQSYAISCQEPLPSEGSSVKPLCQDKTLMAVYAMSTMCTQYIQFGSPCRFIGNVSECLANYTLCDMKNITNTLIDNPAVMRTRYNHDFSACPRPTNVVRPGKCPPAVSDAQVSCVTQCRDDSGCSGRQKCCYNGCTDKCMAPEPAGSCTYNSQCANGGTCYNGNCMCANNYTGPNCYSRLYTKNCSSNADCYNGGSCYNSQCMCAGRYTGVDCSSYVGCTYNSECANGGTCYSGYCSCAPSYTGPYCYTRMPNKTSCTYNSQCANGGTCYNGYCMCANNYTGPNCYSRLYTKNCSSNADCYNGGSCYNSQCMCAGRYTGVDCSSYVGCTYNSECANGGTCYSGYCSCAPSYTGPYCYTRMPNKTSCTYNSQCANGGTCYNGYCMCANNYTGPNCYSRLYTKNCSSNADCYNGGSCYNSQCMCAGRYTGVDCSSYVGCTYNSECANGGTCYSGYCSCAPSYTGPYCYTRMPNKTSCTYNSQCANGGTCYNGYCMCANNYTGPNCYSRLYTKNCSSNADCYNGGSCYNSQCMCAGRYTGVDCSSYVGCTYNSECANGGTCYSGYCSCAPSYTGPYCYTRMPNKTSCTYNSQCANGGTCYNGYCMCANNYTGPNCYSRLYTKNCSSNADCYNGGSCYNSQCMCAGRYTGVDCSSYVGCTYNSECANGGTCYSGYCSCAPSYTGPYCYTRMPNKTSCTYNSQCANGGTCYNGYCMCANNYTGPNCYSRLYTKNCSSNADCYNGGSCYNSQCMCAGRYTGVDCSSYVGCTYNSECANGGTCYSGYCSCAPSYTGPYCYTRMPNKTSCTYNSQCANGGTCYNGYCMCANNYTGPNCYSRLYRKNCSSNADCYNGGSCYNSQCMCAGRYTGVDCSSYVGCTYNSECANGGTCYSGYCSCAPSYTGPYCYTRMPNKTSCTYNSQCANGGTCYNGYCMCANNYTGPNCYSSIYRKNCSSNADCYNGGSCYNSQCNCAGRYTGVDCSSYVGCTYNSECANGGTCYGGYCSCAASYTGPYCYTRILDTTICKSNSECANGGTCYGGYCSCAPSYTGPNCYTIMHNATSCTYNSQCANGGTCYNGYCMCANNYTGPNCYSSIYRKNCSSNADCYNGGSCYNSQCNCAGRYTGVDCSSYVGCTYNSDCANGGTCYSGYCSCAPSYTGPYCYTRIPDSTSCTYNSQCGNGGTCYNGYCMCPVGYTGQYCHTRYPNTTSCTYNSQCANGGTCYNGYCMCANNYTGPNCYSSIYRKNCSSNADCYNGGSCYNSQCMCAGRYTGVDCSSYVGCTYNSDCANGGTCYSGYCSCAPSYTGPYCYTRMPTTGCMYNYECRNGGSCLQGICWCAEGYNGTYCDAFVSDPFYIKDSVTLELAWRQDFFNPSSFVYMDLKNNLQSLIAQMYARQFGIESVTVTGFVPGSVIANFTAYFKEDVQYKTFELKKAKEEVENATLSTSTFGTVKFKRTVKKPGNCPQGNVFEANCRQGCVADDDCWAESKCCNNGCGTDCFSPVNVTECRYSCINGGSCMNGRCMCPPGYTGEICNRLMEVNSTCRECTQTRRCMKLNGIKVRCLCYPEYTGTNCETYRNTSGDHSVHLMITLNMEWMPHYNHSNSQRKADIQKGLVTFFDDMPYYKSLVVDALMPGSVVVKFKVTFSGPTTMAEIESRVERIHNWGIKIYDMVFTTIKTSPAESHDTERYVMKSNQIKPAIINVGFCSDDCRNYIFRCKNGGSCVRSMNVSFACDCPMYQTGSQCEDYNYMDCRAPENSCRKGSCNRERFSGNYTCMCDAGYYGHRCEKWSQQGCMYQYECMNGGSCINGTCMCPPGYSGQYCTTYMSDACQQSPCMNGGSCHRSFGNSSFYCQCSKYFTGSRCEKSFCDMLPINPCNKYGGVCQPDFDRGQLCECSTAMINNKYVSGFFCDALTYTPVSQMNMCDKVKNMSLVTRAILTGKMNLMGMPNQGEVLRRVLHQYGFPEVIRTECDLSGAIVKSCKFHIDTPETEMCYCTDYMGSQLPHTSEFRNELPTSCPPSGFQCQDATCMNSSCYFASDRSYCACPRGYSGTYCQTYIGHVCDSYPCYNNFSCTATSSGSYKCNCPPEWGPNCETVPYWYCNCGPMEKCIRVEYCHNGPCKRKNKCVSYDYTGPCATNPCSDKGMCVEKENGQYMCECYSGYSGFNCEKNTEVCRMVDAVGICVQGSCIGDIEEGRLCKCPRNARGAFCEVPSSGHSTMTKCEYQAELYNTAWKILKRELMLPNIPNAVAVVRNITQSFMNSSEIPMTKCTASGDYTPQQCARNMYTMSERCYCVNSLGYEIFYNITTLPGQQPCTAPDPTDIAKIICGSPVNMCQNGATCVGEIMDTTPKLCDCMAGYEGILCERRTDSTEPQEEYSLCTFSYDSYKLMKSIMSGEFNMTVMGVRVDKNLLLRSIKQMMMSPNMIAMLTNTNPGMTPFNASMFGDDFAIIKPNCTENGDFEQLQCEYGINSGKRYVCYCYKPDGRPIPGTRTMVPMMPNCKMTCPSMSSCPLSCPNGYRRDMTGCAVCECKETCEGKWCMPGTRCVRGTKGTECKKTYKPGMCPIDWMPDLDGIMKLFKDTFDTCDITCHDDADCEGDKKCCGACGNKCVAPYYAKDCAAKKELMDAHWELHWNLSAAMNNPDNDMMMMANKTYPAVLKSALTWIRNTKKMWRPNCNMRGEYERKQCEYNTKTNMKVNCFCANREGKRINGTDSMEPICEEKPGSCQKNMPMDVPTEDVCRYECESDYDCDGHDKCCMNGCNSFCKKPFNDSMVHPGTNMTDMFGKLCMVMAQMGENFCSHGSKCVGDWEQGELCRCPSGYKGALCEEMMKTGEKPPTLCKKRKDLYKLATEPEYMMAVKNLLASINMKSLIVPKAICMDDGMFEPMQCDHDLMSGARKFCYCVNVTGHRLNGTVVRSPELPHCQMGECKPQHMYYSSKSEKPMMCNMKYSSCPYGYVCKEVAYGRHTCCVSHYGHHDICKQAPSHGRWCTETSTQEYVTRHYYNMTLQKCMPFKFRGCHGNDNQFPTEDECKERCVKKEKAGTCPDIAPSSSRFICNNDCDSDGKCAGKRKCCRTDCGYKCLHPKIDSDDRKCKVGWEYTHMNSTPIMCNRVQRNCPTGYSCNFAEDDGPSYCCPDEDKPVDICQQTKVVGPCEAAMRRYYYNRKTEQCEPFIYGGCQGNDNNFGSLEACCRRCGSKDSAQCKPGECPVPDKDSVALCAELCRTDSDCQGEARCCSNGCGRTCIIPPKNITCHMKQREAQMKMQSKKDECNFIHMPRCYPDGSWKSQQCIDSLGLCWCVDRHGRKMPDSLVRGQANCLSFIPYDRPAEEDMPNFKPMDICEGEKVHCCNPALCQLHTCRAHPSAVCRINPCGGCGVEFFDHNNNEVDCDDGYSDCALAYNVAKKHMKQMILNKMLAMKKMNPMMTVNVSEVIMSHMRPKYVPDPAVLPPKCGLDPETGMCRAYMPSWFYNHTSNRCEKFIYGGCGGNDNRFETVEECYQECHEEANPCKSSNKCTATQKCTLGVDYHCEFGPCAHWAECSYIFSDPHISGFPVPMCAGNNYVPTQCHHDICWCLYPNGSPVPGSLAKKNGVNCNHDGTFVLHEDKEVTCPNNMSPNVDCINKCLGQTCAGKPNATCVSSLCDPLCEVKFMEGTEMVDCKSDECSVVHADTPEKCKVEYDCPSSTQPKICKDACSSAKCPGNPCAKCVMDPCTCKAKFMDLLTNKTIDKCTTMMHTPCEMDRCQRMMQKHKEKIATGMSSIVLPECTSSGHYLPQQCEEDACWCVDGRGQFKQASIYDICDRKEVTKVSISFVFKVDFSLVSGDIEGFKDRLIDAMVKLSMIEDAERFISIEVTEGSIKVKVDIEDKEKPENPSPYVNLIGDSLEKNIIDGDMKLDYKGTELVADVEEFERVNRFEGDDKPEPPEKRSPLSLPVIIAIAVGAGIVAALLLSILIYCCCCSRKDSYSSSQGSQAPTEYTPDTKPQPMMMGHANATYGVVTNSHMDNMAYQAGDDMIKVRL